MERTHTDWIVGKLVRVVEKRVPVALCGKLLKIYTTGLAIVILAKGSLKPRSFKPCNYAF